MSLVSADNALWFAAAATAGVFVGNAVQRRSRAELYDGMDNRANPRGLSDASLDGDLIDVAFGLIGVAVNAVMAPGYSVGRFALGFVTAFGAVMFARHLFFASAHAAL